MKRKICILLVMILVFGTCAGCGKKEEKADNTESVESTMTDDELTEGSAEDIMGEDTEPKENIVVENNVSESGTGTTSTKKPTTKEESSKTSEEKKETDKSSGTNSTSSKKDTATSTENKKESEKHKHSYSKSKTNPTCTEQGYTTYSCTCGDSYKGDYVSAKGHTEVIDKAVAATTTSTGLTEGKHCSACGNILVAQTIIPKKNSPSENSTFEYPTDKVLRTYTSLFNSNDYNEYIIEDITIEKKDTSETTFQVKVTLYVIMLEKSGNAPDYIKGSWHLKKDGQNCDWSYFTVSDAFELEGRYVSFTCRNLEEGNYTLSFNGYF